MAEALKELIKSISYDQTEIIRNIINLYIPKKRIECDVTFSKGNFYKEIEVPKYCFDLYPQTDNTVQADCRNLPLKDNSINSLMFDPPFLATTGNSLKIENGSNVIAKRFGVYKNEKELHQFYIDAMKEFYRVLKPDGIMIFKCQDKVSSGKQYFSHVFIANEAEKIGFKATDLFVLLAKSRLVAEWQMKNQKHARKYHSYFWVFRKE